MALRFKQGELAKLVVSGNPEHLGAIVEIIVVGPFAAGESVGGSLLMGGGDYITTHPTKAGKVVCMPDWRLGKLDQPGEPDTLATDKELHEELCAIQDA